MWDNNEKLSSIDQYSDQYKLHQSETSGKRKRKRVSGRNMVKRIATSLIIIFWISGFLVNIKYLASACNPDLGENIRENLWTNLGEFVRENRIFVIELVGLLIFICIPTVTLRHKRKQAAKNAVVEELVTEVFGKGSTYDHEQGIPVNEVLRLNCFANRQVGVQGRDVITGTCQGVPFCCGYETMYYDCEIKDSAGNKRLTQNTLFEGIMVSVPYRKKSSGPLGIYLKSNKTDYSINKKRDFQDSYMKETESLEFNQLFNMNSTDDHNLFYELTPHMMERLIGLYVSTHRKEPHCIAAQNRLGDCFVYGIHICFDENKMYIGFNSHAKYMDYIHNFVREEVRDDLLLARQLVELVIAVAR